MTNDTQRQDVLASVNAAPNSTDTNRYVREAARLLDARRRGTAPQEDNNQGLGGDVIDAIQYGLGQAASGLTETGYQLTGMQALRSVSEATGNWAQSQVDQMSDAGQASFQKQFFTEDENGDTHIGEALTDPRAWLLQLSSLAGQLVPQVAIGGGIGALGARAAGGIVARSAAKNALAKGATREAAEQIGLNTTKTVFGTGGQALAGTAIATGMIANETRDEVMNMADVDLDQSEGFGELYYAFQDTNPNAGVAELRDMAKRELAERTAAAVATDPALLASNLVLDAVGGRFIDQLLRGVGTGSRATNAAKQFAVQGFSEGLQGGVEQNAQNRAMVAQGVDDRDTMQGVTANALTEGLLGGALGGIAGGIRKGEPAPTTDLAAQTVDENGQTMSPINTGNIEDLPPEGGDQAEQERPERQRGFSSGSIDDDIMIASRLGYTDEEARLKAAKRNYEVANEMLAKGKAAEEAGDHATAATYYQSAQRFMDRGNTAYQDVINTSEDSDAFTGNLPAVFDTRNAYEEAAPVEQQSEPVQGETIDGQVVRPALRQQTNGQLESGNPDTPYVMGYGDPEQQAAARAATEQAFTQQQGNQPRTGLEPEPQAEPLALPLRNDFQADPNAVDWVAPGKVRQPKQAQELSVDTGNGIDFQPAEPPAPDTSNIERTIAMQDMRDAAQNRPRGLPQGTGETPWFMSVDDEARTNARNRTNAAFTEQQGEQPGTFDPIARDLNQTLAALTQQIAEQQGKRIDDVNIKGERGRNGRVKVGNDYQPVTFKLVDLAQNPALNPTIKKAENQFRDRNRAASQMQINSIASDLDFNELGESPRMSAGAPTLSREGMVIGGNGRLAAIRKAYTQGSAENYREELKRRANEFGINPTSVHGMKQPVLIRQFKNPVEVARAAIESNNSGTMAMSALEQAAADSELLPSVPDLDIDESGNINWRSPQNIAAVRGFIQALPEAERASLVKSDGTLAPAGIKRFETMLAFKAYGDSQVLGNLVENANEESSLNIRGALMSSAPKVAMVRQGINRGEYHNVDITDNLIEAIELVESLRQSKSNMKQYLAQLGMVSVTDDVTNTIAVELEENLRSARELRNLIEGYYTAVEEAGHPDQTDMFGTQDLSLRSLVGLGDNDVRTEAATDQGNAGQNGLGAERAPEAEARGQGPDQEQPSPQSAAEQPEDFLTSYTEEDLQQQVDQQRQAEEAERQQEAKAKADDQLDDFVLSGSNNPVDQAEARGQNSLFGAGGEPATPTNETPAPAGVSRSGEAESNAPANPARDPIRNSAGKPFKTRGAAKAQLRKNPGYGIVEVDGGFELHHGVDSTIDTAPRTKPNDVIDDFGPDLNDIDAAAQEAATSPDNDKPQPTDAQIEAGNYEKGHVTIHGMDVAIENPRGSNRSGTDPDGNQWSVEMKHHYGYIKKTTGADGEHIDVFIGKNPESEKVFIVDQVNADGSFDEHKVMVGFSDRAQAITGYKSNYQKGWKVGPVTEMSVDEFKQWLDGGDTSRPVADSPEVAKIKKEIKQLEDKRNKLNARQMNGYRNGSATRARTTTHNAETSRINERLASLRSQLKDLEKAGASKPSAARQEFNFSAVVRDKDGTPYHVNSRRGSSASLAPFKDGKPQINSGNPTVELSDYTFDDEWWSGDTLTIDKGKADLSYPVKFAEEAYSHSVRNAKGVAQSAERAYINAVRAQREDAEPLAKTEQQRIAMAKELKAFQKAYLEQDRKVLNARSGVTSAFVAGASKFNNKQASSRSNALDKAHESFDQWLKAQDGRVKKAVLDARNSDQLAQAEKEVKDKATKKAEDRKNSLRKILNMKPGDPVMGSKEFTFVRLNKDRNGYPKTFTFAGDGIVKGDDKIDIAKTIYAGGFDALKKDFDAIQQEDSQAADTTPEVEASENKPLLIQFDETMSAVRDGKATLDQYKAGYRMLIDQKDAVLAEMNAKTKPQLLEGATDNFRYYHGSKRKGEVVDSLYKDMLDDFALHRSYGRSGSFMLSIDEIDNHEKSKASSLTSLVEGTTESDLKKFADDIAAKRAEYSARLQAEIDSLKNPETLSDYRKLLSYLKKDDMTTHDAYLKLKPEQRTKYDELNAESTREARERNKREINTKVIKAASELIGGSIQQAKHTRDGYDLWVVVPDARVEKETYYEWLATAKSMGGKYSGYRKGGAIPGFQFRTNEAAEAFLKYIGGDTDSAQTQVDARRDAYADDKSQSAVERLTEMAAKLDEQADAQINADRKTNTSRRARFAAAAIDAAERDKALAETMRGIAKAIDSGSAKFLDAVRAKTQVEALTGYMRVAKGNEIRDKYPNYADQQKHEGEKATAATVDYAEYPAYVSYRSDLASLARKMKEVDGLKKLGDRLLGVADDVTDAYLDFAKKNLDQVSRFSIRSGDGERMATFSNRSNAEASIRKSGLTGKAIVLPIKRGENAIILSPSEAMNLKVWEGDHDKRITLGREFGAELVRAISRRGNKTNQLEVPWQLQNAHDRLNTLSRMGIETASEFRSALREFVDLQKTPERNKIREMELAMVGRKNDGLDFFPTPEGVADQMIESAEIAEGMRVLEPSAGMGHIADRIREAGVEPDVVEFSADRRDLLKEKDYHVVANDFTGMKLRELFTFGDVFKAPDGTQGIMRGASGLGGRRVRLQEDSGKFLGYFDVDELVPVEQRGAESGYDRIIMNPPFSNRRDAEHVQHAYDMLKPGGRIVAIMGEGVFFGSDKKAQAFRDWLDAVEGSSEKLPPGSFMDPNLPANTNVNARMVVIDKPTDPGALASLRDLAAAALRDMDSKPSKPPKREATEAQAQKVSQVEGWIAELQSELGIKVNVIPSKLDLPTSTKMQFDLMMFATSEFEGVFDTKTGELYLIADSLDTKADALRVVLHEAVGHKGVIDLLKSRAKNGGREFEAVLDDIYKSVGRVAIDRKIGRYGFDYSNQSHRRTAVLEYIAHMAETGQRPTLVQRVVAALKSALRRLWPQVGWTETDVLALIEKGRQTLGGPDGPNGGGDGLGSLARLSDKLDADTSIDDAQRAALDKIGPKTITQSAIERIREIMSRGRLKLRQGIVDRFAALLDMDKQLLDGEVTTEENITKSAWVRARMANAASGAVSALMNTGRIFLDADQGVIDVREGTNGLVFALNKLGSSAEVEKFMGWIAGNRADKLRAQGRENLFTDEDIDALRRLNTGTMPDGRDRGALYEEVFNDFQQYRDDVLAIADKAGLLRKGMEETEAMIAIARENKIGKAIINRIQSAHRKYLRAEDADEQEIAAEAEGAAIAELSELLAQNVDDFEAQLDNLMTDQKELWMNEFYVPFYRVLEEQDQAQGPRVVSGLSRQEAYKKLKGGTQNVNDLLQNTIMNFHHLLDASMKNIAAQQAIGNAEQLGIAEHTSESTRDKKASTYILRDGKQVWYNIDDPLVYQALTSLNHTGMNGYAMKVMRWFKRTFTNLTTSTPQFVVANLLRDSMSAIATTDLKANPVGNVVSGIKGFGVLDRHGFQRARLMASGGAFSFGHVYGEDSDSIKFSIDGELRRGNVIRDKAGMLKLLRAGWDRWQDVQNSAENANRMSAFQQAETAGKGKLYAAFQARDLMDFSGMGAWPAIRFLIDTVPFLNARIQGLDKLYRSGVKPSAKVAMNILGRGEATGSDKKSAARFMSTVGALTAATIALYLHNKDDEEFKKAPDWMRDTYWWVRVGDDLFLIPKPFEVGAMATMAERLAEQIVDDKATGEMFAERVGHMLGSTFSFSPVPQLFQPTLDLYANKDSFTGRDIETLGQQRLSPANRVSDRTSTLAKGLGRGMEAVLGDDSSFTLSPVQIDYLIGGYFGQVGAWTVGLGDIVAGVAGNNESPSKRWYEYQPARRFYRDLNAPDAGKYQTLFYDSLREAERLQADLKHFKEAGDALEASRIQTDNKQLLQSRIKLQRVSRQLSLINTKIKNVQANQRLGAEEKRRQIDLLKLRKAQIIERIAPLVKKMG